jgi:hypothetical protein
MSHAKTQRRKASNEGILAVLAALREVKKVKEHSSYLLHQGMCNHAEDIFAVFLDYLSVEYRFPDKCSNT